MKFLRIGFACILVFLVSSCTRSETKQNPTKPDTAIIVVPGFKGSILREKESRQVIWLDARFAFYHVENLTFKVTSADLNRLTLPSPFSQSPEQDDLLVDGILGNVPLLLGLHRIDIYGSWIKYLQKQFAGKARVIALPYDWRRDNLEAILQLAQLVQDLRLQGFEKIYVIGHSMGGLITSYYLRYGSQPPETAVETWEGARSVNKVVLAGVPFRGAMQIFFDMQTGSKTVLNATLFSPDTLNSFPSSYRLLPAAGVSVSGEKINPRDPQQWLKYRWGYFAGEMKTKEVINQEQLDYMARMFKRANDYTRLLEAPLQVDPSRATRLLNVIGESQQTLDGLHFERKAERFELEKKDFSSGDTLVSVESATLPPAYESELKARVIRNKVSHGWLLKDARNQEAIASFLREE